MGRTYTAIEALAIAVVVSPMLLPLSAQTADRRLEWRKVGNSSQLLGLPSPAGGPAARVWFSADDGRLFVRLADGRTFSTSDTENWRGETAGASAPAVPGAAQATAPEPGAKMVPASAGGATVYAASKSAWRSDDGGINWTNLTDFHGQSLLGSAVRELAVDPKDEQRIAVAASTGVWLSVDGGRSWQGLNDGLPNLPLRRILAAPSGSRGVRISVDHAGEQVEMEWKPGQRLGWSETDSGALAAEAELRGRLSSQLEAVVTAVAASGDAVYAGAADGRLYASADGGATWRASDALPGSGPVERIWLDPADASFALAVLSGSDVRAPKVRRTLNGGGFWDDLTSNLADTPVYGISADRASGTLYVATARGVFFTSTDLRAPVPATTWQALSAGLPDAPVRDVRLDDPGNLLMVAVDGHGLFAALAPHRARQPAIVHSADYTQRAAAPGALLSVLGAKVASATANSSSMPVLSAAEAESQVQVPFEAKGETLQLVVEAPQGRLVFGMPLQSVAPSVLVDREGAPVLMDGESGLQLDAMNPARPGMRVQVLMSGLGRVQPDWPSGLAAPLEDAPRVVAPLRAVLDGAALKVERATLAPGYIGYYLVEIQMPEFVNSGASELHIEAAGAASNHVRLYVAQ